MFILVLRELSGVEIVPVWPVAWSFHRVLRELSGVEIINKTVTVKDTIDVLLELSGVEILLTMYMLNGLLIVCQTFY